jgi:hypothetical protein
MNNLYYDKKEGIYYFCDLDKKCDNCKEYFSDVVILKIIWDKLGSSVSCYCRKCKSFAKINTKVTVCSVIVAMFSDFVSKDWDVSIITKPSLMPSSNLTILDVDIIGGDTVDKTVYAGRESWSGSNVGSLSYKNEITEGLSDLQSGKKIKMLDDNALDNFLLLHKNSVPILESSEKVLLSSNINKFKEVL